MSVSSTGYFLRAYANLKQYVFNDLKRRNSVNHFISPMNLLFFKKIQIFFILSGDHILIIFSSTLSLDYELLGDFVTALSS